MQVNKDSPTGGDVHTMGNLQVGTKSRLKNLKVKEVSLVKRGANPDAKVILYKSHELINDDTMQEEIEESLDKGEFHTMKTIEELQKAFEAQAVELATLQASVKKSQEDVTKANTERDEAVAKAAKSAKDLEDMKDGGKDDKLEDANGKLKKSMPEDIRKKFEELEEVNKAVNARLEAQISKNEEIEFAKKAEDEFPNIPGESVKKGKLLQAINKMDEAQKEFALTVLKSADESLSKAMKEIGSAASPTSVSASEKLTKQAESLAADKKITFAKAYDEVISTTEGKKLYEESCKK